ncbi:MAG: TIM barrel protein [Bacteroidales bacterium]|nr:TIM barrel protein [Bacteroidales bacterium]
MYLRNPYSRRNFIKTMGAAGAGVSLLGMKNPLFFQGNTSQQQHWKIFMFSKHLQFLSYEETAETMKEAGLAGADLTVRPGGHVLPEHVTTDLPKAVNAFEKKGLKVGMMTSGITDADDRYTDPVLKTASDAGIRYYRLGYYSYIDKLGIKESIDRHKQKLEKVADLNSRYNMHGGYQNHSGTRIGGPVWDVWMLVKDFDPRLIGCQYDIRHATVEGGFSWPLGLQLLQAHVQTIVIKDFKWMKTSDGWDDVSVPLGEGMVNFDKYFSLLKELNIRAPITLHFEYPLYEGENLSKKEKRKQAVETISKDVKTLKNMLAKFGLL